jgi:chromosome segregation ATPase
MTPTDLETLHAALRWLSPKEKEALTAVLQQHTALLTDYEACKKQIEDLRANYERLVEADKGAKHDIKRLMDTCNQYLNENERMRELVHKIPMQEILAALQPKYHHSLWMQTRDVFDALHATLKGEKHE